MTIDPTFANHLPCPLCGSFDDSEELAWLQAENARLMGELAKAREELASLAWRVANLERAERGYTLPPGYHLKGGRCPACGGWLGEVDRVEGLPIWACPQGCEIEEGGAKP